MTTRTSIPPTAVSTFGIVPLREQVVGDVVPRSRMLIGAVAFVLLIACANVANLLLSARSRGRRRWRCGVRWARDAARLVRQLLTESILLALGGGALGILLAFLSLSGIRALGAASVPRLGEIAIDGQVLLFTLAVSVGSGSCSAWRPPSG